MTTTLLVDETTAGGQRHMKKLAGRHVILFTTTPRCDWSGFVALLLVKKWRVTKMFCTAPSDKS